MKGRFWWDDKVLPFSFKYNGEESAKFIAGWKKNEVIEEIEGARMRQVSLTDPITQLRVTVHIKEFSDFNAFDWVAEFENKGKTDSPIIENILPLDFALPSGEGKIFLHHAKGSFCQIDDFLPMLSELKPKQEISLTPFGGRSSNGIFPFMNLQFPEGGFVLAIGWSGQWTAKFERSENNLRIRAGMEHTHLILHPGEKIRTPRILILNWEGDDPVRGNNLLRRIILERYAPRINGKLVIPPIAFNMMYGYYTGKKVSEEIEIQAIERAHEIGIESYWLDAYWYGKGDEWWKEVGTWVPNKTRFPRGLKPLGEAARKKKMGFVLWFEPERAHKGSEIETEHPEFLLKSDANPDNYLFNLGMPQARAYITEKISKIISESGVTIYRHDLNFEPLSYWKQADKEDRIGMTEIRHIEGLYAMWDELLSRHPGLAIDNCASGGRRIDLETISRSFPLWRSDFTDVPVLSFGMGFHIGNQCQVGGLSRWIPFHTGEVWKFQPYEFRGTMSSGIVFFYDIREKDFPVKNAKRAIAELKSLRPYFLGDFYLLHPLSISYNDWFAYQYNRPDLKSGFAVFLRRHESAFTEMEAGLKGIDPQAKYKVSMTSEFGNPDPKRMNGKELVKIKITIPEKPGSILLRYSCVR